MSQFWQGVGEVEEGFLKLIFLLLENQWIILK